MTSVFDGLAGVTASVLGAPVPYLPKGGPSRDVQSVFRETPIEATDQDGHPVLIVAPTWRVRRNLVPELARGDKISPANGKAYAVKNIWPSGSPAADAAVICELELVTA
ncbi:head-tail joining protein [Cypionkella sinensis]|uniref:Head-to-tail stopper n=1 Tax=Cypionkella sinensis TaxID=1756043 RepID=A0ABV7IXD6_9RHOB